MRLSPPRRRARHLATMTSAALLALLADRAAAQCAGDCNGDRQVAINELISGVTIALGSAQIGVCPSFDSSGDGSVAINELIAAVNNALVGCTSGASPTPTATAKPTLSGSTPTRTSGGGATPTPTSGGGVCGNHDIDIGEGETCDDGNASEGPDDTCPANCRVATCARSGRQQMVDVVFDTDPADLLIAGMTLWVRYPDGTVSIPGANSDPPVQQAVVSDFFSVTPNDLDFSLRAVLLDPFFTGVSAGPAFSIAFELCGDATAAPASAFRCEVVDASDPTPVDVTVHVSCRVVPR